MISGGEHLEWPMPVVSDEILNKIEKELTMLFDTEHEEATWEWLLEQGPPQDDDIRWIKAMAFQAGADCMSEATLLSMPSGEELDKLIPRLTEDRLTEVWRTL